MANPAIRTMTWVVVAWGGPGELISRVVFENADNGAGTLPVPPPMDRAYTYARSMVGDPKVQRVKVFCKEFPETGETFYPGEPGEGS